MTDRSILDIDEARKRLETIERDHAQFVELIAKLKEIRTSLLDVKAAGATWLDESKTWLASAKQDAASSIAKVSALTRSMEEVAQRARTIEADLPKAVDTAVESLSERAQNLRAELVKQQAEWERRRGIEFEDFNNKHFAALDGVTKSYERMRVAYDSMKVKVESWDVAIGGLQDDIRKLGERHQQDHLTINGAISTQASELLAKLAALENVSKVASNALSARLDQALKTSEEAKAEFRKSIYGDLERITQETRLKNQRLQRKLTFLLFLILLLLVGIGALSWRVFDLKQYLRF
jgi:hypothetical protein